MDRFDFGRRLKMFRQNKNLSLDEAPLQTGVSKPMLGQIERGYSFPTVNTLWKIATGLKIPLSSFFQQGKNSYTVIDWREQPVVPEEDGAMRAYLLFPFDPVVSSEGFYIEFDAGCRHASDRHEEGVEELVFVLEGKLDLILDGVRVTVGSKQAIRFRADIPHVYENPYTGICSVHNTIFYRR